MTVKPALPDDFLHVLLAECLIPILFVSFPWTPMKGIHVYLSPYVHLNSFSYFAVGIVAALINSMVVIIVVDVIQKMSRKLGMQRGIYNVTCITTIVIKPINILLSLKVSCRKP